MEWISIKESSPGYDKKVLTYRKVVTKEGQIIHDISTGILIETTTGYNYATHSWRTDSMSEYTLEDISHWMPLPEPPTE